MTLQVVSNEQACAVSLYRTDARLPSSERLDVKNVLFSTAQKANEVICEYFDVHHAWDNKLLRSIFERENDFHSFEFKKLDNEAIAIGIDILFSKENLHDASIQERYQPIENKQIVLNVCVSSGYGTTSDVLDDQQLIDKGITDNFAVSLFNCSSFKYASESQNRHLPGLSRTLQKDNSWNVYNLRILFEPSSFFE